MSKLLALDKNAHRDLKVKTDKIEAVGARERLIPVVLSEFLKLSVQYPIVLTKTPESEDFVLVAMMGFEQGENLFWRENRWDGLYLPLNIARQPFFLGKDQNSDELIVCLDMESDCLSQESGEALYDADGTESDYLLRVRDLLSELIGGDAPSRAFIKILDECNLITPLSIDISFANGKQHHLQSIYTIDEQILEKLNTSVIAELHRQKLLKPIYLMIASLGHIYGLIQRKNRL